MRISSIFSWNATGLAIALITTVCFNLPLHATTYYINSISGNDNNSGTSAQVAFQSLERIRQLKLQAGDKVLFAKGLVYKGSMEWEDLKGDVGNPIFIGSYKHQNIESNADPLIDAAGYRNGILLLDCSNVIISSLEIKADGGGVPGKRTIKRDMRCGILVTSSKAGNYENITLQDLTVRDVFYEENGYARGKDEVRTANGTQNYGWGIRVINSTADAIIQGIRIESCIVKNLAHTGIKFTGRNQSIRDISIQDCQVTETGGPGMQFSGVKGGLVKGNVVNGSGSSSDTRKWGRGSGMWTWSCSAFIIEHNAFRNAKGPGDSAGCHIDFNCSDVIVQYNLSENNAGGFCEILGNNHNCAYRYNISVNDGWRIKKKDGAFQEGKIFWLSGFVGKSKKRSGPFNSYFYNNTIYVKSDIEAKVAVDRASKGALLMNNIFYIEGSSKLVLGDQYRPEQKGASELQHIVFTNNLFLAEGNWPKEVMIQDDAPFYGNPEFINGGGSNIRDYIPLNASLVKDRGLIIERIPGDEKGLFTGLNVQHDILGNEIQGKPDMGAIEINMKELKR